MDLTQLRVVGTEIVDQVGSARSCPLAPLSTEFVYLMNMKWMYMIYMELYYLSIPNGSPPCRSHGSSAPISAPWVDTHLLYVG